MLIIGTVIFSEKRLPPFSTFQPKNQSFLVLIRGPETFTDDERLSKLWIFMILQCHITYLLFWSQIFCKKTRCSSLCNRVCSREFPEKNFPFPEFFRKDFFQNRKFSGQIGNFLLHFSMNYGPWEQFSAKNFCKKISGIPGREFPFFPGFPDLKKKTGNCKLYYASKDRVHNSSTG